MLDPQAAAVEGVMGVGDVAGGEHARDAGLEALVGQDAVVDWMPGGLGQPGARRNADADDDEVGLDRRRRHGSGPARPSRSPSKRSTVVSGRNSTP